MDEIRELQGAVSKLRQQQLHQESQVAEIESENRRFCAEYAEVEHQNSNLANLYVASYRLHGSLDRGEVLQVIHEIIINLIGSEELAVFELDADKRQLTLLSSFGIDAVQYARVPLDDSPIAMAAKTGEMFVREPPPYKSSSPISSLTTCIPLKVADVIIGVIAVFRMLPQKPALASVDRELFALLGSHSAMALYCSGLHARVVLEHELQALLAGSRAAHGQRLGRAR